MWLVGCNGAADCSVENNTYLYFWPPVQVPCFIVGMWAWFIFRPYLAGTSSITRGGAWLSVAMALAFALVTAALGVWLAKGHEFAPFFAACGAVGFLLFACSRGGRGAGQLGRRLLEALRDGDRARELRHLSLALHLYLRDVPLPGARVRARRTRRMSLALFIVTMAATLVVSVCASRGFPTG